MIRVLRSQVGGERRASRRGLVMAAALLTVVAGCAGEPAVTTATEPPATTPTSSVPPSSTTTVPPSTTSVPNPTTTTLSPGGEEAVVEAWNEFWAAWVEVRGSEELERHPLEAVADPSVVDGVISLFERQRQTSGPVDTNVTTHPTVTMDGESAAVIEDCVLLQPTFAESVGVWYEADLQSGDDGWTITDLSIRSLQGCVPADLEEAAIDAYEAYLDAEAEFWDPPNPNDPLLAQTMTEPRLSNIRALLAQHQKEGVAFRSNPTTHPEVIEVRSESELVLLDCYEPSPTDGVYDSSSGQRLADQPTIQSGQRNLRSAVMVFEDGKWKASDFQGQVDFECEFAPTERGLPSV